jgi:hypothetical protein
MFNERNPILRAGAGQENAASQEDVAERVRKLHEDLRQLSEKLARAREITAPGGAQHDRARECIPAVGR